MTEPIPRAQIPLAAEILGYVGGSLALGAVAALLTAFWGQLGTYGRIGIALGVALAGLVGGWAMARSSTAAAGRLTQFLLFVGAVGTGAVVGFGTYEIALRVLGSAPASSGSMFGSRASEWAVFAGFAALAVAGGVLWWRRRTTMQHLAFGLGVGVGTLLLLPLLPVDGPYWGAGLTLAFVGLVWGALGLKGWLPPENIAFTLASMGVLGGVQMMSPSLAPIAEQPLRGVFYIGLAVSVVMVVGSILMKRMVLLGFGAAGIVVYAFQIIDARFRGTIGAPIAMLIAGLLFVGMSIVVAVLVPRLSRQNVGAEVVAPAPSQEPALQPTPSPSETPGPAPIPLVAEILGYVGGAFAVGAAIALMATFWTQLGLYGRLGVALTGAAVGIVGGLLIGRQGSRAAHRLEQFMLAIGTIAIGFAVGIVAYELLFTRFGPPTEESPVDRASSWAFSLGCLAAALAGLAVWWRRRAGLQLAVFGFALVAGAMNGIEASIGANQQLYWLPGATLVALGVLFGLGALLDRLKPVNVAYAIGATCVLMGIQGLTFSPVSEARVPLAMWAGLVVSIALIVGSIPLHRAVILGFGAVGVVIWSTQIVTDLFGGRIAGPILLLVIGVVFVAMAVVVAMMLPRLRGSADSGSTRTPPVGPHMGAPA